MDQAELHSVLPLALATVCFPAFWFISTSERIRVRFQANEDHDIASVKYFLFSKTIGFLLLGIVPLSACLAFLPGTLIDYGVGLRTEDVSLALLIAAGLCALVIPLTILSARKAKNHSSYPQIRARIWTYKTLWATAIGWFLYLVGYELLFRGILLFPLVDQFGFWPAIAVNTALYSATHIPKGAEETFGAILLGVVLCLVTLATGMIWTAIVVHFALALSNCLTAFKVHPHMTYS